MKRPLRSSWGVSIVALAWLTAGTARATIVTWDVDPSASYLRLTVPDQQVPVAGVGNVTIRLRDPGNNSQWTDAGGRRAALDGQIVTDYVDATSIEFLNSTHDLYALEQTNLRPNPAKWDGTTSSFGTDTSTAPAAFGARIRGTYLLTFDAAYMAMREVRLDVGDVDGVALPIVGGAFAGGQTNFGITSASVDVDGLAITRLGQPVDDILNGPLPPTMDVNIGKGGIADLGGGSRQLTYAINMPNIAINLEGIVITGSAAGQIVAYATVPEPSSLALLGLGAAGLARRILRRRRVPS